MGLSHLNYVESTSHYSLPAQHLILIVKRRGNQRLEAFTVSPTRPAPAYFCPSWPAQKRLHLVLGSEQVTNEQENGETKPREWMILKGSRVSARARNTSVAREEFEGGEFLGDYLTRDKESARTLLTPLMCLTIKLYS